MPDEELLRVTDELLREACYQPFYCEENVWQLCHHPLFVDTPRWALFISNEHQRCALWHQRAATTQGYVVWDYHVVMVAEMAQHVLVWDPDCSLGMPLPLHLYLDATFPELAAADAAFRPRFRLLSAADLAQHFSSDRRHMRDPQGQPLKPVPGWPAPRGSDAAPHTLDRFIDVTAQAPGEVLTIAELRARWPEVSPEPDAG